VSIIRVFPRRTRATPDDDMAFVGDPPLFRPPADEVHVSCTFTWDRAEAERLVLAWGNYYPVAKLGGPAYGDPGGEFVPGRYLKPGYIITSRGCCHTCEKCLVPEREGRIRTLMIGQGWDVLDNNLLACPREHIEAVLHMLACQDRPIRFTGGLEAALVRPWFVERLYGLHSIDCAYLAYDRSESWDALVFAVSLFRDVFPWADGTARRKLACYILCGYDGDTVEAARERIAQVVGLHVAPFPMFYLPPTNTRREMPKAWHDLVGSTLANPQAAGKGFGA
jgi:hypothetical protein